MRRPVIDAILGTTLGSYRVEQKIAQGGMGSVYLGVQPAIGSRVAIKVLSDRCAASPDLVERFFSEARAVNMIRHEAIVNVVDMAKLPDGRPYLVMEYVDGQTLGHIVRRGRPPLGGLARAIGEVLAGLGAAHAIGIVHRDLKPDNIFITQKGHAKILDFGIAKLARGLAHEHAPRTYTDDFLGTPAYMSPEQIERPNAVDARSDLYSMGVVLYEAIAGRAPFAGTAFELMRAHVTAPPPPLREVRPDVPPALEDVVMMALEKDPARRFENAAAMGRALRGATTTLPVDEQASLAPTQVEHPAAPAAHSAVGTPPAYSAVGTPPAQSKIERAPLPSVVVPTASAPSRARWILAGAIGISAIAITIGVVATRGDDNDAPVSNKPIVMPDPKLFDVHAFLPDATTLARREARDAQLVEIQLYPLGRKGLIDLTRVEAIDPPTFFKFVSKTKPCAIVVTVAARGFSVERRDADCDMKPVAPPRCRLGEMIETFVQATIAGAGEYIDSQMPKNTRIPITDFFGAGGTRVRYIAGEKRGRWKFYGGINDGDEHDDDCDRDER